MTDSRSLANVPARVLTHLRERNTLTLATVSPTGEPHASMLIYASNGLTLYAWARVESATVRNVADHPAVGFTIGADAPDRSKIRGIEGSGTCRILRTPDEVAHAAATFRDTFPTMGGEPAGNLHVLELTPSEIWFIEDVIPTGASGPEDESKRTGLGPDYRRVLAYSTAPNQAEQDSTTVAPTLDTVRVPAGAVIVRQGTPADTFYIVVDGAVAVLREEAAQSRQVETLRRGQFFGEIALLRDVPRTATVQALVPTTLLALDRAAFRDLVLQSLGTASDLERIIEQRLTGLSDS